MSDETTIPEANVREAMRSLGIELALDLGADERITRLTIDAEEWSITARVAYGYDINSKSWSYRTETVRIS